MFSDVTVFRFPQFSALHDHPKAPLVTTRHLVDPALLPGMRAMNQMIEAYNRQRTATDRIGRDDPGPEAP